MKTKEKKGLHPDWDRFLRPTSLQAHSQSRQILIANANEGEGTIFAFNAKTGLKSEEKGGILYTLHSNGGLLPPPPFPLTTLLYATAGL